MSEGDRYKNMLENVWPPPSEETRARLQRLQELEDQRRQRLSSVQQRTRSSSLDRGPSSSRELLLGSRSSLNRTGSFRSSGRRLTYQRPTVSSATENRSRTLQRSVSEQPDDASTLSSDVPISSSASAINLSSSSSETEKSNDKHGENISENTVPDKACSINVSSEEAELSAASIQTKSTPDKSITTDDNNDTFSSTTEGSTQQSRLSDANANTEARPDPSTFVAGKESAETAVISDSRKEGDGTVKQSAKTSADTEIEISSQQWSVSEDTDRKLQDIMSEKEARLAKLKELENLRLQGRVQETNLEEMGMSARERFNLNYSANVRPQRQLSLREQIRRERRARRHSDLQLSSTSTFGTDQTGSSSTSSAADETSGGASGERTSRAMNPDAWDVAFSGDREERMKRMKELDRMRKEGRGTSSFDTDRFSRDAYQPTYDYSSHGLFPLASSRQSESMSSLLTSRRPLELPLQYLSISEQREPSLFSSSSTLARTSSTHDVLARARETINSVPLRRTVSTTETRAIDSTEQSSVESRNQTEELSVVNEESDEVPVYIEGTPQGVPYVDDQGHTHWLGPTSPKYNELVHQSPGRNQEAPRSPQSTVMSMRETDDDPIRARQRNRGLPPEIQDHYLAECFDPKYTLKERIVLIRKKLWGDPPQIPSFERGKPDGASLGEGTGSAPTGSQGKDDVNGSEGTKTI